MSTPSMKILVVTALCAMMATGCATRETPRDTGPTAAELEAQREAQRRAEADAARRANEAVLAEARTLLSQIQMHTNMNADQQGRLRSGESAINSNDGRRAVDLLGSLLAELRAARMTYSVVTGDSLWRISGRSSVYGNPYQWPLIYKANADKIRDADLIHPNQQLTIVSHPVRGEVDAAVNHARTRGAWQIGVVEDSDRRYLGR